MEWSLAWVDEGLTRGVVAQTEGKSVAGIASKEMMGIIDWLDIKDEGEREKASRLLAWELKNRGQEAQVWASMQLYGFTLAGLLVSIVIVSSCCVYSVRSYESLEW